MAIIVSNFKNERFLNQVDILYQIFCYRGGVAGGSVEERFKKRLSSWKGKHLFVWGRLTLMNSVISSLTMYMMSFSLYREGS
jgi:hypothetical protein